MIRDGWGVLPFPTHCIGSTVWPNWDRISHLGKINFCLLSERLLMMMLMTMSKTLRSSLNCFFAFSWFSSSGVWKTKQIRGLQNSSSMRGMQNKTNQGSAFCQTVLHQGSAKQLQWPLSHIFLKQVPVETTNNFSFSKKVCTVSTNTNTIFRGSPNPTSSHPALFPLHDSSVGGLGGPQGVHLHLHVVDPAGQWGAQDLQLHLLQGKG